MCIMRTLKKFSFVFRNISRNEFKRFEVLVLLKMNEYIWDEKHRGLLLKTISRNLQIFIFLI